MCVCVRKWKKICKSYGQREKRGRVKKEYVIMSGAELGKSEGLSDPLNRGVGEMYIMIRVNNA